MAKKSSSVPEASERELRLLQKIWTISDEGQLVFFSDAEDPTGKVLSKVSYVEVIERKVNGKVVELVTWYTMDKKIYTVDWGKSNFAKSMSAPLMGQFMSMRKPSLRIGMNLVCQPASTMKQGVRSIQRFLRPIDHPPCFIVEATCVLLSV